MSLDRDDEITRWTARGKSALAWEIQQGKTTVSDAARQCDLAPSEVEAWLDQANVGI